MKSDNSVTGCFSAYIGLFQQVVDIKGLLFKQQPSVDLRHNAASDLVLFEIADSHIKYMLVKGC